MKRLLLSFIFSILTAVTAQATADLAKTDHAIKLIKTFEADKVDQVINSSVNTMICSEGSNAQIDNERKSDDGGSRTPGFISGKGKFQLFKEAVMKGSFHEDFYKEGDVYSYSSEVSKPMNFMGLEFAKSESEHVFVRKSQTVDHPFEHEFGLTEADVQKGIMKLLNKADENYQTDEKAFIVRIKDKAYLIDMRLPLMANPVYKQDVNTGDIDYGFAGVTPRYEGSAPVVSMSE
jgi:hypothetical protein